MEISEEGKKSDGTPGEAGEAPGGASESKVPQSLFKKALPWGVFALLVVLSVAFMRMAFPEDIYEESFALYNAYNFSIPHLIGCLVRLGFPLVWMGLFFALLKKLPLWLRGLLLIFFFLPVTFALYLRKYYGMEIDFPFFLDCLNTNLEEVRVFISFHAVGLLIGFVPLMFAVAWGFGKIPVKLPKSKIFVGGLLLAFVVLTALPYRIYVSPLKVATDVAENLYLYKDSELGFEQLVKQESEPQEVERVPAEISHVNAVPIVVLHVAESARADHAPFNGYARNTMPNMLKEYEAGSLISFPKCVSFSTQTVFSMLGIMSPSTVLDNAFRHPTFIPALNQNKVETCGFISDSWQLGLGIRDEWVNAILGRMQEVISTRTSALALLPEIREKLADDVKKEPPQERFYLYYGGGSHTPFTRYDYDKHAVFRPTGDRIYNDERDVNNYDNTFVATDEFCEGFIGALRNKNAVYIFVGDHGTMLGEDGTQGRPYRRSESRHVLFFIWASDKFKAENPKLWATLVRNREKLGVVSHDFIYNSVLHLFSLRTPFYNEKTDLFSDSAEPFPTEMPEAKSFGPMKFGENAPLNIELFEEK